ncbi:MAG TPA: methionyl-tRNA formyltransferase [Candidatus Binatia bacterium]|nr:methionyl-tRNA formyltransferase [Candidatus Binatia bacterium]
MSGAGPTGRARAVFFGSGSFALPILESLVGSPTVELVAVVSVPDRAAGRAHQPAPTPVSALAIERGLPLLRPGRLRDPEAVEAIAGLRPEIGILADYGRIVPQAVLAIPPRGILNIHPSLLPRWRGASPIQATIAAGDRETGVSIIAMDAGIDTGPVVAAERWALDGTETAPSLETRAAVSGAALLARTLPDWLAGTLEARGQSGQTTTTTPLRREDGRLDPGRPAVELERLIRALQPWPGTFVETPLGRLAVLSASAEADTRGEGDAADAPVGRIVARGDGLALVTVDGLLTLDDVQPAGGRPMPAAAYRRGRPSIVGEEVVAGPGSGRVAPVGESGR